MVVEDKNTDNDRADRWITEIFLQMLPIVFALYQATFSSIAWKLLYKALIRLNFM